VNHDRVNAGAEAAPGFVWRNQQDVNADGSATALEWDADARLGVVVNLSVWRDVEALESYTYGSAHRAMLARRREWFEQLSEAHLALWWIAAGTTPTMWEARARLRHLRTQGPTPHAFTLQTRFPPAEKD
jgi:YD repeat-containing protein